jgi:hypothetical protein
MNERIQELAEQAREYATTRHPVSNIILSVNSDLFEQKFAELIVKECLEACSRANEIRHFVPPTQQQVVLSCMDEIERTFRS